VPGLCSPRPFAHEHHDDDHDADHEAEEGANADADDDACEDADADADDDDDGDDGHHARHDDGDDHEHADQHEHGDEVGQVGESDEVNRIGKGNNNNSSMSTSRISTTATANGISELKANSSWAKLPLFDRKGWKKLPFRAFAESIGERVEPADAAEEIYVGLDDLDSGDLHIKRWGKGSDVIGTKLRFRKGDIIFGRRRAYQRKLAVAEVDGICSAHAMVVRAKPELVLPEFLPFLMMSDKFMKRAVEISVGSLSPTINWTALKAEEFILPPIDQQRQLAEILWAQDEVIEAELRAIEKCNEWFRVFVDLECHDLSYRRVPLSVCLRGLIAGKSVVGVNEPATGGQFGVLKISAVGPNGFDSREHKRLIRQEDFIPRFAVAAGDFLITRCNTMELVGRVCIVPINHPELMLCDKTLKLEFDENIVEPAYMEAVLRSQASRAQIESRATGTGGAMKNITQDHIRSLVVPLPELKTQKKLVQELKRGAAAKTSLEGAVKTLADLRNSLLDATMTEPR
jgi:restriction endonuclease S subunit